MFGMGTGVSSHLWSPTNPARRLSPPAGVCRVMNVSFEIRSTQRPGRTLTGSWLIAASSKLTTLTAGTRSA